MVGLDPEGLFQSKWFYDFFGKPHRRKNIKKKCLYNPAEKKASAPKLLPLQQVGVPPFSMLMTWAVVDGGGTELLQSLAEENKWAASDLQPVSLLCWLRSCIQKAILGWCWVQIDIPTIRAQLLLISCQMQPTHCPQHTRPWPEANPSTMLQSWSHSWGAVMEGLSERCLAGRWRAVPSAFPKALWGSLLVSQEWGHEADKHGSFCPGLW